MTRNPEELRSVRQGEEFDTQAVQNFLRERIPDMGTEELHVYQFTAGHSNLTYLLRCGEWEAVLRRPPLGPVAKKAHDMAREARFLSALYPLFPLAPRPYVFCDQAELIGSPFFVMERKKGVVVDKVWPESFEQTPEICRQMSEAFVDTLVQLHAVEYKGTELENIGHPEGYMQRQVLGWIERYGNAKTEEIPEAEIVSKWLHEHIPESSDTTVIHNDFKLNNMLFAHGEPSKVTAVLDWEMATLGDPLSDLAVALSYWAETGDPEELRGALSSLTTLPGFYSRSDLIEAYARKSGRNVEAMDFYLTFAYFKIAVISQQIFFRWKRGQTHDERFAKMGEMTKLLIHRAFDTLSQAR
jgi:aminoglycoside phosphotransferase (APT) family kinase protein